MKTSRTRRKAIHAFLRAYYHMKSADWKQNAPFPLKARTASEWAKLPRYYVMDLNKNMAETVAPEIPSPAAIAACKWLPDDELRVYSSEFGRTGFQGGLNGYRVRWSVRIPRNCGCSPAVRLMSHHCLSAGRAIGPSFKPLEISRKCRRRDALEWRAYIFWKGPDIGCSKSNPSK